MKEKFVGIHQRSVVLHLVFETGQFLDDPLALFALLGIIALGGGSIGIVDSLSLGGTRSEGEDGFEQNRGRLTMMTGHRSRAVVHPNEVLSPVV